ncbi:hypothetical protein GGQ74_000082 [Desulfobaculum xiamenense]|uniref:Holin of 3TMs, for gene-transfer release n=1 Tax=Desulfobaculum xiamenense TaxID=995050 RepID=A0A846QJ00_9BACT|nr:3TM-type holin [Desulfobaculum xiamenense]NJB66442.1 hypothetical protein [Desulfobaculum xiamenense]
MNWADVGKRLLGMGLPLLGTAIAGPGGAAVGGMVASALGLAESEPQAVLAAIDGDAAAAMTALSRVEEDHHFELERLSIVSATEDMRTVNGTMQTETRSEDTWSRRWRPFWGFCSALAWSAMACAIAYGIARGTSADVIAELRNVPETFWLIPLTILGVASYHRGRKQRIEAGEQSTPSVLDRLSRRWFGGAK